LYLVSGAGTWLRLARSYILKKTQQQEIQTDLSCRCTLSFLSNSLSHHLSKMSLQ
jgi:hypothetical protein